MQIPRDIPGIEAYVEDHVDGVMLRVPARDFVIQGLLVALTTETVPAGVHAAVLVALLVPYSLWRIVARVLACYHAWNAHPWVMPWLAPVARRWERDAGGEQPS